MSNAHTAMFWGAEGDGVVSCTLCPHGCKIPADYSGLCGVRRNSGGELYAEGYGIISNINLDPIEKKPLRMFRPGKLVLSISGFGCNMRCPFCQNSDISLCYIDNWRDSRYIPPEQILALAQKYVPEGNIGVAYTYNEPLIGYEYLHDCAPLIHGAGLHNVVVTNGLIKSEPLQKLLPYISAMNIDIKGFTQEFYKKIGGDLDAVKETVARSHKQCHVEITTLIIPGKNDTPEEISELARWIATLDPGIPLHLTRFFPRYKYANREPTSREIILLLKECTEKYLRNVFIGNI